MAKLNRIRIVLAERDLNNKWLADKLGKDQATISKWVTNTTQPSLEALIAIANALEVPVQELVRQEEFNKENKSKLRTFLSPGKRGKRRGLRAESKLVLAMPCKKEEDEVK